MSAQTLDGSTGVLHTGYILSKSPIIELKRCFMFQIGVDAMLAKYSNARGGMSSYLSFITPSIVPSHFYLITLGL